MRTSTLLTRNLRWYWRTNLAVLLGVATATGVLAGALAVGESVRASLRDLVLGRLGNTESIVVRGDGGYFRQELGGTPIIAAEGAVTHESSKRRAGGVQVYGQPGTNEVLLSAALARELEAKPGDTVLLRVPKPSAVPLESLHGRKDETGKTIRLNVGGIAMQEFSLRAQQGDVRAVYLPLARLQRELGQRGKANTLLLSPGESPKAFTFEDAGLKLRPLPSGELSLESDAGVLSDALVAAAPGRQILTYLANTMTVGGRQVPYSLVTATDAAPAPSDNDGITLNEWAARDLNAKAGDALTLEYFVWASEGRLATQNAQFRVSQIVPITGAAADRNLAPDYPGITESESLHDWDPPFPLDLSRIRPIDEQYWKQYRTTPKAFIRLARGQQLWASRYGRVTSVRMPQPPQLERYLQTALVTVPVRAEGLAASKGATDFGEYFLYFSFFVMVSALLLTGLFFKLGVEQRMREIGVLRALGFSTAQVRRILLLEGAVLAGAGAVLGIGAALAYEALILYGLRTWWVDAVGTRLLTLHASPAMLAVGTVSGVVTGLGTIAWTLRRMQSVTPRGLVLGEQTRGGNRWRWIGGAVATVAAAGLALGLGETGGFFGAGALLLIAALLFVSAWLRSRGVAAIGGQVTLGLRSASYRPGRSVLCIALIASAVFLIVSLDAFRRDGASNASEYPWFAESAVPVVDRAVLDIPGAEIVPFRLKPGDDTSCLNLYRPQNPRILGVRAGMFPKLEVPFYRGEMPTIGDANSLTYVLHLKVGDFFKLNGVGFGIVDMLHDSLFQGELLISEANFLRLFPEQPGFRFFLLKAAPDAVPQIEEALSDYGFDVQSTAARLASFHRVENTYLSTFQALGGLGLVLGTIGLAAILLRNVLERRRELALLRAVGYRPRHLAVMVLAENLLLLLLGLGIGSVCALLAVAPRGGQLPLASSGALLAAVLATGVVASVVATAAVLRAPLLGSLRSE